MNEDIKNSHNAEQLNEAFEMTKLRLRYKKYIGMMQKMLKDFKDADEGVNIINTFGMSAGLVNSISAFFGFGKNEENKNKEIEIGVIPFTKNLLKNIQGNYEKSKKQFDALIAQVDMKNEATTAKAINAASAILYQFFDEYMNTSKLLSQGGIDITANKTLDASTFKTYNLLINSYNPKGVGNNIRQFQKLSASFDEMVKRFDLLGQRLVANFTKYFNKLMQKKGKDNEKIANALEGAQAKLSIAWKNQTDIIKTDFPAVIQTITSSQEYSKYYEFIIKEVLPKVNELISSKGAKPAVSPDEVEPQHGDSHTPQEEPAGEDEIEGIYAEGHGVNAFVFSLPNSASATTESEYHEDDLLTEADVASATYINLKNSTSAAMYKFKQTIDEIKQFFDEQGVKSRAASIKKSTLNIKELLALPASFGIVAKRQLIAIVNALTGGKTPPSKPAADSSADAAAPAAAVVDLTNQKNKQKAEQEIQAAQKIAQGAEASADSKVKEAGQKLTNYAAELAKKIKAGVTNVAGNVFTALENGAKQLQAYGSNKKHEATSKQQNGLVQKAESMYVEYSLDNLNESYTINPTHTYVLVEHCWGDGSCLSPEDYLVKDLKNLIKESKTITDIAHAVKNTQYMSLYEYENMHKLNAYGAKQDSFTAGNPLYTATVLLYESNDNIVGGEYLGLKKIVL